MWARLDAIRRQMMNHKEHKVVRMEYRKILKVKRCVKGESPA